MKCPACSHENRAGAKYCEECAAPLRLRCASCGAELRPAAKFCDECAAPTSAGGAQQKRTAEAAGARKVVTVVFADLVGSTALHERVDAESARRLMERYYEVLRTAVEEHGGTVVKLLGDGVMAAFGVPQVAEDDALRAVRAGVAMQDAFRALMREQAAALGSVGLRVAVNTGEVVVSGANDDVVGDPVNVAARLQQEAHDGDVVIGEATQRLVESLVTLDPLGSFALRGRSEAVRAYRVESLERPAGVSAAPFVGRDSEVARLTAVYAAATAAPAARLGVVLGSPGLGKSRLIGELGRRLGDRASVVAAHCNATGGATFAPLAEALRDFLGVDDAAGVDALRTAIEGALPDGDTERGRIVSGVAALLAGAPASPEETFFVVRRLFAALAARKPLVLVIDDLHWAEPLLLDLVEHLIQWGGGVPLFVLVGARPELRDARSSLATPGGVVADVVTLGGLDAGAATRLAAHVIGAVDLPAAVAAKVLATSEGNPLFVGELVRMLVHEGVLTHDGDRWTVGAGLADFEMPPTIHALLAARIERLRPEERTILERAAVIGRHFSRSAVAELLPRDATDLDTRLEVLRRSELIERDTGWFLGEPVLRFHHVLIRDAAYRRLLKETRAELHSRFADWIEARVGDAIEHDETIGWHLEQAHQLLGELGPIDEKGRTLGERAARRLAAAGRRALARDDVSLAANLVGRALARLDATDPARADLVLDWCEALLSAGEVGSAAAAIDDLGDLAADSERLRAWHACFAGQLTALTAPEALHETADAVAAAAQRLATLGDNAGEAKAHFVHAQTLARLGEIGACEAALDRALAAARRAGDRRRANAVLAGAPVAALWGPSPVTRASGRCLDVVRVLRITQGAPAVEAVALSCQGVLEALRGRTDAARRMIASAREMVEELGISHRLFEADVLAGRIELLENDAPAAERSLRGAYEGLRELGLGIDAARAGALLARALLAQDRAAEAETLSHESEALAGDDLQAAIAWRGVRAEALARRGEAKTAVELAQAAVAIAAATDALLDHAYARLALAAALRASGRSSEADAEERRAVELWEAKGATLLAERARSAGGRVVTKSSEPTASVAPASAEHRRVRANAATADAARLDAAILARDSDRLLDIFADGLTVDDRTTGVVFDRQGALASFRSLISARDPVYLHEPLATLGESLGLFRLRVSARGAGRGKIDVGAYEKEEIHLCEIDAEGRRRRGEVFAPYHLGAAFARLYERYADSLPDGPARDRAAGTARSLAIMNEPFALERVADVVASDIQIVDYRTVGVGSLRGAEAWVGAVRALAELAESFMWRLDDIVAASPDAVLVRATNVGTVRATGGAFERPLSVLMAFGADGRIARWEQFDRSQESEALARFDELAARTVQVATPMYRRVRANAATATAARLVAAFAARDVAAVGAVCGEHLEVVDHPNAVSYGRDGQLDSLRRLWRAQDPTLVAEPLATLGDSLFLARRSVHASGTTGGRFDVAEWGRTDNVVFEVDEHAQYCRIEIFAADHLGDAIACLYRRYAELQPEGPARDRATTTAFVAKDMLTRSGDSRLEDILAPDFQSVDHRMVGYGAVGGSDIASRWRESWEEVAEERTFVVEEVLALRPNALLRRTTTSGKVRASGGEFEVTTIALSVFGPDGLHQRLEIFEVGHEAEAFARFDELTGEAPVTADATRSAPRRERPNAAVVTTSRFEAAIETKDDAAALPRGLASPFENAAARVAAAGFAAYLARDWQRFESLFAAGFRYLDRRRIAQLELDREQYFVFIHELDYLDTQHGERKLLATRGHRFSLQRFHLHVAGGDVGASEIDYFTVVEVDGNGLCTTFVRFDADDLDAAYAELDRRYDAGGAAEHARPWAAAQGFVRAVASRDWDAVVALCADTMVEHDHRGLAVIGTTRGADAWARNFCTLVELASDTVYRVDHFRPVARGFYSHGGWRGSQEGGAYEIPLNAVIELDERGRFARSDIYDDEGVEAALARLGELQAAPPVRNFANAASRALDDTVRCFNARDWDGMVATYAPKHRMDDRRRLMRIEVAGEAFLANERLLFEVSGSAWQVELLATRGERLALCRVTFTAGGEDRGPMEVEMLDLVEVDSDGRRTTLVVFDPDDLDAALAELDARFKALSGRYDLDSLAVTVKPGTVSTDASIVKPTRASVAMTRWLAAFESALGKNEWAPMRRLCRPDMTFEDRCRLSLLSGDVELMIASARERVAFGAHPQVWQVGTAGDRVVIARILWSGGPADGRFEIEYHSVVELDEEGLVSGTVLLDDADSARREAWARWAAIEPVAAPWLEFVSKSADSFNDRDESGLRALFADLNVVDDHRRTGIGRLEGCDAYVDAITVLWELSPDMRVEFGRRWPAYDLHAAITTIRRSGTIVDGGEFESEYLMLYVQTRGAVTRLEMFETDDLDRALARFEELRPDPLRIPPNAATRARDLFHSHFATGDFDAVRALCAPIAFEDRRRLLRLAGDVDVFVENVKAVRDTGLRPVPTLLATAGDRLALYHILFSRRDDGQATEVELLQVFEVDADERITAIVVFDPDDRAAAFAELIERYVRTDADALPASTFEIVRAWNDHDLDRLRALLPKDYYFHDRRRTGVGRLDGADAYLASLVALFELSADVRTEYLYQPVVAEHGGVSVTRWCGTNAEGGEFEAFYVFLGLRCGDRVVGSEVFELDDFDLALARFEELAPKS